MVALAGRQHGVVARWQLLRAGATVRQVEGLVARGEIRALHPGVYLVGSVEAPDARAMAAVLACGAGALVSHRSASCLYALLPRPARPGPVHVTVPGRHVPGAAGIAVHETTALAQHEVRERDGIPVTAPNRTLIDLAACARPEELERAVAEAFALGLTGPAPLLRALAEHRGRRGVGRLRTILGGDHGAQRTRSGPERRLLRLLRAAGVEEPAMNVRVRGWEVDFHWAAQRLVVEVDAYATHSSPSAFERDRRKSGELTGLGLLVHRVTARRISDQPELVVADIRRLLARTAS